MRLFIYISALCLFKLWFQVVRVTHIAVVLEWLTCTFRLALSGILHTPLEFESEFKIRKHQLDGGSDLDLKSARTQAAWGLGGLTAKCISPHFFEKVSTVIMHLAGSKKWPHLKVYSRVESYIYNIYIHMQRKWYMYLEKQPNSMGSENFFFLSRAQRLRWSYY